jgi:acetyl esterase/lipase
MKKLNFILIHLFVCNSLLYAQLVQQQREDSSFVVPLWQNGAPGFENRKNEPEQAKDWWVKNIHNPSLTVFLPPKEKATGAAVVICPGGGHRNLGFNGEGVEPAKFFNSIGVAAFVLKYRLFREENSPYTIEHAKQDGFRTMRLVRSRAAEWNIDTARLGMMGFSAGGEMVSWIAYDEGKGNAAAKDIVERYSSKPSFQILIYPGPLGIPDSVSSDAPPAFLLAANDDVCCSPPIIDLLQKYRKAKVPVEVHIYAKGDHAFNMGNRSTLNSIKTWRQRLADWLKDNGWLDRKGQ